MKIATAKALADDWAWEKRQAYEIAALCSHFDHVTPHDLIAMWESGKNMHGKPLTQFEAQAIAERWCAVFGEFPPDDDDIGDIAQPALSPTPEPELPDDTMLRAKDVVRLTGLSLATLKRMSLDGRFAKPMRLSPRRIGWPARDVRAWLETADGARQKARL